MIPQTRWRLFLVVNALVFALLGIGTALHPQSLAALALYVQLLCLLCTLPLCWTVSLRGPMALLVIMQGMLFVHFGLRDLIGLVFAMPLPARPEALLSGGEIGALITALCVLLGYGFVIALGPGRAGRALSEDWSPASLLVAGTMSWVVGYGITAYHLFSVADLQTGEVYTNPFAGVFALLRFLQPVGTALLAYLFIVWRRRSVMLLLVLTFVFDVLLGYLGDSKETAFRGMFIVLISYVLLRDRIPVLRAVLLVLVAGASFSYFAAYRDLLANTSTTRVAAAGRIGEIFGNIAGERSAGNRAVSGLDYFTERSSLKGNLELIVRESGRSVPFQNGRTLVGVLYTFLPRYLFPDKPDTSTGRLFNATFGVSSVATTYISQGINGELYWNFGWSGLILGMVLVGALLGYMSHTFDLQVRANAPRFLFLIVTAYELCVRFEGNFSSEYTYWMRALLLLWLVHRLMPKLRGVLRSASTAAQPLTTSRRRGPNLVPLSLTRVPRA